MVLAATLLSLAAAVLHAAWNLLAKQSPVDRFVALWAQFLTAGILSAVALVALDGLPTSGIIWATATGVIHVPYCWYLAKAYASGDFSVVYPIARGGGAALAGLGGVVFLGDRISLLGFLAMLVVCIGIVMLAGRASRAEVMMAGVVALSIAAYTVVDAQGARTADTPKYALAVFVSCASWITLFGVCTGRASQLAMAVRCHAPRFVAAGCFSLASYTLVIAALRLAPTGYVAALRESSVVLAALVGTAYLGEGHARQRVTAAGVVLSGLIMLVIVR